MKENFNKTEPERKQVYKILLTIGIVLVIAVGAFLIVQIVSSNPDSDASVTDTFDTSNPEGNPEYYTASTSNTVISGGQVTLATTTMTVIYIASASTTGNLGGVSGANTFCTNNRPSNLPETCTNTHAFLSVDNTNEIRDMPSNYGYATGTPIYWWHNTNQAYNILADDWTDMLDGTIQTNQEVGTGNSLVCWTGSDIDGSLTSYTCTNWTQAGADPDGTTGATYSTATLWINSFPAIRECERFTGVRCMCEFQ